MVPNSAEKLFSEVYFIYTLGGKVLSKILNIGQEFMKKIDFANTQPLLMTFTLLNIIYVWLSMTFCTLRKEISKMLNVFKKDIMNKILLPSHKFYNSH